MLEIALALLPEEGVVDEEIAGEARSGLVEHAIGGLGEDFRLAAGFHRFIIGQHV